jgi:hypothetical protein
VKHPVKYAEVPIRDGAVVADELLFRLKKMEETVFG